MTPNLDFQGRVVIVTGGSSGIGAAAARAFSAAGAAVALVARNGADAIAAELDSDQSPAVSIRADVSREDDVERLVTSVVQKFGTVDVLLNCAGVVESLPIEDISLKQWDDMLRINLTSQFLCCRQIVPLMKQRRSGKIINVSSIAGRFRSSLAGAHYVASKAGVLGLTRQLAYELAPYSINVNAVCPSQTRTPMLLSVLTPTTEAKLTKSIPLGYIAETDDQVGPILFLASDAAKYMTGAILDVTGGQL